MKANELMIEDWVWYDNQPYQIRELGIFGENRDGDDYPAVCVGRPKGIGIILERNEIEPIPLIPEILEKNGFTRYGQVYANLQQWVGKFGDKRKSLFQDIRTGQWGTNDVWIEYVHELQHVLKLCRIEKTIEL